MLRNVLFRHIIIEVIVMVVTVSATAQNSARMHIGMVDEEYQFQSIAPQARLTLEVRNPGSSGSLMIRKVVADDVEGHTYDFEVRHMGQVVSRRAGMTNGFGRRTFFLSADWPGAETSDTLTLEVVNRAEEPLHIESILPLPNFDDYLKEQLPDNDFTFALLVNEDVTDGKTFNMALLLEDAPGVKRAIAREMYYVRLSETELRADLDFITRFCEENGLTFLPVVCSWWAGTPFEVWKRPDFQQVCYSETDTHDSGPELKKLLGDKWDPRYGFSVPNMWSNTPWQTMNNPELNELRHTRLTAAVKIIEEVAGKHLAGYVTENEPAYWAFDEADYMYPVKRKDLMADFNPHCVAAAKADGIELDPRNGLSLEERSWLLQNLTRYMQNTIDVIRKAGSSRVVYSHALLAQMFPFKGTGRFHPYAEVARTLNSHVGVETLWRTDVDGLWRVREWGPWACVNREENDATGLDYHVAMLRLEYMMGAELFNSYNWNTINQQNRCMEYMNTFMADLRNGGKAVSGKRLGADRWIDASTWQGPLPIEAAFPWANQIELTLRAGASAGPLSVSLKRGVGGEAIAYKVLGKDSVASSGTTLIDFGDLTLFEQDEPVTLHLDGPGWEVYAGEEGPEYILSCDMLRERRRSQHVIKQAQEPGQ